MTKKELAAIAVVCSVLATGCSQEREDRARAASAKAGELKSAGYTVVGSIYPSQNGPIGSGQFQIACDGRIRTIIYGPKADRQTAPNGQTGWWKAGKPESTFVGTTLPPYPRLCKL